MVRGSFVHCSYRGVCHQACSGAVHLASSFPSHPFIFSPFHCFISVTGAWNGGSWLGCGDLTAMGAVFYLGAGWPQWKPLGIPGTHLPLKRGSWLDSEFFKENLTSNNHVLYKIWKNNAHFPFLFCRRRQRNLSDCILHVQFHCFVY